MKITVKLDHLKLIADILDGLTSEIILSVHPTDIYVLAMDMSKIVVLEMKVPCTSEVKEGEEFEVGISVDDLKTACEATADDQVTLDTGGGKIHISCGRLNYHFDFLEPMYIQRAKAARVKWEVVLNFDANVFAIGVNAIAKLYKSDAVKEAGIIFTYMPGTSLVMWDKDKAKLDSTYLPNEYNVATEATRALFAHYPLMQINLMRKQLSGCDKCQVKFADNAPLGVIILKKGVTIGWVFAPRIKE